MLVKFIKNGAFDGQRLMVDAILTFKKDEIGQVDDKLADTLIRSGAAVAATEGNFRSSFLTRIRKKYENRRN